MAETTKQLWKSIEPIFQSILEHPFLTGLVSGELEEASFRHYVIQDTLYLRSFSRALATLGARADSDDDLMLFCDHASNAILVERELHKGFLDSWEVEFSSAAQSQPAPNTLFYTSYLLRVVLERPFYEGLGAVLPCYWIYHEVGKALEKQGSPHPLYQQWIATYSGEVFGEIVQAVLNIADYQLSRLNLEQKAAVESHFIQASRLEYLFWDMGYHRQTWPV